MDLIQQQIKDQLYNIAGKAGPVIIEPATVLTVNVDATVHIRFSDDSEIEDARLKSVIKAGNQFLIIPATGSTVQVARIENSEEYVIIAVEEIVEIKCLVDAVAFSINTKGFLLKKENASLKEALKLLIEAVQVIVIVQGTNPDYVKLQQALEMVNKLLR